MISGTTGFAAVYLTYLRSHYFVLAYAANDMVLILLWSLAAAEESRYISVAICFCAFLAGDLYGFISWQRMRRRRKKA